MLLHVDHAVEGRIPQLGFPIKLSDTPCEIRTPPPLLGEHNEELLKQVGYSESDVAAMRTSGVIA
jgi:crotonobetainyl-CoA:carnitine CoA-transferase CaiB-like acyl-CoA transferase